MKFVKIRFFCVNLYLDPKLFNISISWSTRQGKLYTPVSFAVYNPVVDFYQPVYGDEQNRQRFGNYNTINISLSKMYSICKTSSLIVFFSINNLLNTQNPKSMIYNKDYLSSSFDYYQRRSVYFGCMVGIR